MAAQYPKRVQKQVRVNLNYHRLGKHAAQGAFGIAGKPKISRRAYNNKYFREGYTGERNLIIKSNNFGSNIPKRRIITSQTRSVKAARFAGNNKQALAVAGVGAAVIGAGILLERRSKKRHHGKQTYIKRSTVKRHGTKGRGGFKHGRPAGSGNKHRDSHGRFA